MYSSAFGGWIGLLWSENEELPFIELFVYYLEHFFTSFGGPLILSLSGRYDPLTYTKFPLPVFGFHLFVMYMRWVLTPLSLLTWANLNHTLCGVDNDPIYVIFELGETYYMWADVYLGAACYLALGANLAICYIVKRLILGDKSGFTTTPTEHDKKSK